MSVQCACRALCFPAPAPVQMPFRLGFADKTCSFFTVKNFTEQKFQVHKNWEMGHFSDPASQRIGNSVRQSENRQQWAIVRESATVGDSQIIGNSGRQSDNRQQ